MITAIFVCQKRYEYFNILKVYDKEKYEFVAVLHATANFSLTSSEQATFSSIHRVDKLTEESLSTMVELYLSENNSPNKVRLICLDEINLLLTARIREKYGIPGAREKAFLPFRDKLFMKDILKKHGIRVPKFSILNPLSQDISTLYTKLIKELGDVFIIKPVCGASSLGTNRIDCFEQFKLWVKTIDPNEIYDAEEFIDGTMFHCNSFVLNNTLVFSQVCEYTYPCLDFLKGKPLGDIPLLENHPLIEKMYAFNEEVLSSLGSPDGATHLEFFVLKERGEIVFIEIAARPPGGIVVKLLEKTFGINLYELSLRNELGEIIQINPLKSPDKVFADCHLPLRTGKIKKLHTPKLVCDHSIIWDIKEGDFINKKIDSIIAGRAGLVTFNGSYQDARKDFEYLKTFEFVTYE